MAFLPIAYPYSCSGTTFYFQLAVFANDGTVVISPGGTEMGQVGVFNIKVQEFFLKNGPFSVSFSLFLSAANGRST